MARRGLFDRKIFKTDFFTRNVSKKKCERIDIESQLALEKAKRRAELRAECLKQKSDPFQHAVGDGGAVFDQAVYRYNAMRDNQYDYFKTSPRQVMRGFLSLLLPMGVYSYWMYNDRNDKEAKYRNGEVAYKNRDFLFK